MSQAHEAAPLAALDALPTAVIVFDSHGRLAYANRRMLAMAGVEAARLAPGTAARDVVRLFALRGLYGPGDPEAQVAEHMALNHARPQRRLLRQPDGGTLELRMQPLPGGGQLGCLTEVTALVAPFEDAMAELRRLERVFEALGQGVAVFDGAQRLALRNMAYAQLIGLPAAQLPAGVSLDELLARQFERGEADATEVAAWGESVAAQPRDRPLVLERVRRDGSTLRFRRSAMPDGATLVEVNDITPLRAAEAEARRRASLLDSILAAMPVGVLVWSAGRHVAFVNDAYNAIFADTPASVGESFAALARRRAVLGEYGPGDADALAAAQCASAGRVQVQERHRPNGRIVAIRRRPLPDGGEVVAATDVTELHAARAEASAQAQMLRTMLESMHHGIALFDEAGHVLAVNRLAAEMAGLTTAQFAPGRHFTELRPMQIAAGEFGQGAALEAFLARRPPMPWRGPERYVRRRPNGQVVEVVTEPVPGGGFVRTYTDITALHDAEAQAAARANTLSLMLDGIRHGILLYGPDMQLVAANTLAAELTGLPDLHRRAGMSMNEILAEQHAQGAFGAGPEAEALLRWQTGLDRGRPFTFQRTHPDGRVFEVVSDPTPDGGCIVAISDVTALVRAETEAKRRSEVLGAMLENTRHGICLFGPDHRVVAANSRFPVLIGARPQVLAPGATFQGFVDELLAVGEFGTGEAARAVAAERMARDRTLPSRLLRRRPSGRWIEVVSDPMADGGFVLSYSDVTEEQEARAAIERARAAAEAASEAKSSFLATMSHELRTPLTAVIGFAEALERFPEAENRGEFVAAIRDAGRHLLTLITDILDMARSERGGLPVRIEHVPLAPVLAEVVRVMQAAARAGGVRLETALPAVLPDLSADALRLRQVLLNLLANAVKFTPEGGRVALGAALCPDGAVEMHVTDTGIGMAEADIPRAFEPFQQLDSGLARRFEGSGLGLPLSRALAEAQGATLSLRSRPGEGTTATLRFPRERVIHPERTMP